MICESHPRYTGKSDPTKRKQKQDAECATCLKAWFAWKGIPFHRETMRSLKKKSHYDYRQKAGNKVQGITTVESNHNGDKMGMVHKAWQLGCDGINYKDEWYGKADMGTICHEMIRFHLAGLPVEDVEWPYDPALVSAAEAGFIAYLEWEQSWNRFETIFNEKQFVSEVYPVGFTLDWLGYLNDSLALVDFKTGKRLYPSATVQVAGTKHILETEFDYKIDKTLILHLKVGEHLVQPEFHEKKLYDSELQPAIEWFKLIAQANPYFLRVYKGW